MEPKEFEPFALDSAAYRRMMVAFERRQWLSVAMQGFTISFGLALLMLLGFVLGAFATGNGQSGFWLAVTLLVGLLAGPLAVWQYRTDQLARNVRQYSNLRQTYSVANEGLGIHTEDGNRHLIPWDSVRVSLETCDGWVLEGLHDDQIVVFKAGFPDDGTREEVARRLSQAR